MDNRKFNPVFGATPFVNFVRADQIDTAHVIAVTPSQEGGNTQEQINRSNLTNITNLQNNKLNINDPNGSYTIDINRPAGSGMTQEMRTYRASNDFRLVRTDSSKVQMVAEYGSTSYDITLTDGGNATINAKNITLGGTNARYKNAEIVNADMLTDIANTIETDVTDIRNQIIQETTDRQAADDNLQSQINTIVDIAHYGQPVSYDQTNNTIHILFSTDGSSRILRYAKRPAQRAAIVGYTVLVGQYYTTQIGTNQDNYFTLSQIGTGTTTSVIDFEIRLE